MYHSFNIAVIIPCYNEQKAIAKVINDFKRIFQLLLYMYLIIIRLTVQHKWQRMLEQQFTLFL